MPGPVSVTTISTAGAEVVVDRPHGHGDVAARCLLGGVGGVVDQVDQGLAQQHAVAAQIGHRGRDPDLDRHRGPGLGRGDHLVDQRRHRDHLDGRARRLHRPQVLGPLLVERHHLALEIAQPIAELAVGQLARAAGARADDAEHVLDAVAVGVDAGQHVAARDLGGGGDQPGRGGAGHAAGARRGGVEQPPDDVDQPGARRIGQPRGVAPRQAVAGVDAQRALDLGQRAVGVAAVEQQQRQPTRGLGVAGPQPQAAAVGVLGAAGGWPARPRGRWPGGTTPGPARWRSTLGAGARGLEGARPGR
jgi:hypothetical protein